MRIICVLFVKRMFTGIIICYLDLNNGSEIFSWILLGDISLYKYMMPRRQTSRDRDRERWRGRERERFLSLRKFPVLKAVTLYRLHVSNTHTHALCNMLTDKVPLFKL